MLKGVIQPPVKILHQVLIENGGFPNNPHLPVVLYKEVLKLPEQEDARSVMDIFAGNGWSNAWINGIYSYHHYHSNTHEVIGIIMGWCTVMLGGEKGVTSKLKKGDVLVIPAGVAHKSISHTDDFRCVGAYPDGRNYDMNYGKPVEHPASDLNIFH